VVSAVVAREEKVQKETRRNEQTNKHKTGREPFNLDNMLGFDWLNAEKSPLPIHMHVSRQLRVERD